MANSQLYDKTYKIPNSVINGINSALIKYPTGDGVRRAKFLVKNKEITYQSLKRLKNFFDYFDKNDSNEIKQYYLAGGKNMKNFVEGILKSERDSTEKSNEIRSELRPEINTGNNVSLKSIERQQHLNEEEEIEEIVVIAVIVNRDRKYLLGLRNETMENGGGDWALFGGHLNVGEDIKSGCVREIKEETGLTINNLKKRITNRKSTHVEHVFCCFYSGSDDDVVLNSEHSEFGWFSYDEIKEIDNLMDDVFGYVKLCSMVVNENN